MDDPFASLPPYEFVLLTTFRKSGVGVPTAMWFAHEPGKLYMVTGRTIGKLKRIRTTSTTLLVSARAKGLDLVGLNEPEDEILEEPEQHLAMDVRQRATRD